MRFAYAGIDFLGGVLTTLLDAGWEPVKLFTRPCDNLYDFNDDVVAKARARKIPIQLSRLRDPDLDDLAERGCDALVVAGYPWLIKGWESRIGHAVNLHPSPLPIGRGPYPLFQAVLESRETWGVSLHALEPHFDTGAVLAVDEFRVSPDETHDSLLAKCQLASGRLARRLAAELPALWAERRPQVGGSYWPRITDRQRTLDWTGTVAEALRTVRAFGSIEALAKVNGASIFVRAATGWQEPHRQRPGTVVHAYRDHLVVAVADGYVQLTSWSALSRENLRSIGH